MEQTRDRYLLGHDQHELARLEHQGAILETATTALLKLAGIRPGTRVLDLGSGAGDVAFAVSDVVGPTGAVLGIDRASDAIETARARAHARGATNVTFAMDDIHEFLVEDPFDAVVGRLVLLYVRDPAAVVRRYAASLRPGGVVLAMEYDMPTVRSVPPCPTVSVAAGWVQEAFARASLDVELGARLGAVLRVAGLSDVTTLGVQPYLPSADGATLLSGIVRTLLPVIERTGVARPDEVGIATLQDRIAAEMDEHDAIMLPPTLVGAWARVV